MCFINYDNKREMPERDPNRVLFNETTKRHIAKYSETGSIDEIAIGEETYWCFGSIQFIKDQRREQYENGTPLEVWRRGDPESTGVVIKIISIGGRNGGDQVIPFIPRKWCEFIVKVKRIQ